MSRISDLEELLNEERLRLGASSCTFYAQDPYWGNEFRLICMPGVMLREPMYGWIFNKRARSLFCEGGLEVFCTEIMLPKESDEVATIQADSLNGYLFHNFAGREGVKSFARLHHIGTDGAIDAVVFVNFGETKLFDDQLKGRLREVLDKTVQALPGIIEELRRLDAEHLAESIRIVRVTQSMASTIQCGEEGEIDLKLQLENVLKYSLEALRIPQSEGRGAIHEYEPDTGRLRLKARCGLFPDADNSQTYIMPSGHDVVAWVTLMRTPLLINALSESKFRDIAVNSNDEIKSKLAVPMIVNDEVVGVLSLESTKEHAFDPASVRSIWYAANSAAVASNSLRIASTTRRLLDVCQSATADKEGAKRALKAIAGLLSSTLGADSCDIWHFNSFLWRFDSAATSENVVPVIRVDGWTDYVWRTQEPVWLYRIKSESEFSAKYWRDGWEQISSSSISAPNCISREMLDRYISAEIGLPIMVSRDCVGVAWIKYHSFIDPEGLRPPSSRRMEEAFSVSSQAGLVLELIQRQIESADRAQLRTISEKLKPFSASCSLNFGALPLEGYIIHKPFHAHACGDFHATSNVDKLVVGLLIGDGEGKAVTGLLNALPLITGFEAFGGGSGSTRHVIDRLREVSRKLGLAGTALYWTFTQIGKEIWLTMTSAGHDLPILIRPSRGTSSLPADRDSPALGKPLGLDLDSPQGEHLERLLPGDILIAYTDGVIEAFSEGEDESIQHAFNRIMSLGLSHSRLPCREMAELIMAEAEKTNSFTDDATLCVIKYEVGS